MNELKVTLENKENALELRSQRVKELEELIAQKDAAVNALKDKVSNALLAFENKGLTVDKVLKQIEKHKGYQKFLRRLGRSPKLFISEVQNLTSEAYFPIDDMNDELLNEFSALDNVAMPSVISGKSKAESLEKAAALLNKLGITAYYVHENYQLNVHLVSIIKLKNN